MEITFKLTEEMMQEAFENSLKNIEIQANGMSLNECVGKQIPMKPDRRHETAHTWDAGYCPVCGCGVTSRWSYCQNCGQRIDWSK